MNGTVLSSGVVCSLFVPGCRCVPGRVTCGSTLHVPNYNGYSPDGTPQEVGRILVAFAKLVGFTNYRYRIPLYVRLIIGCIDR